VKARVQIPERVLIRTGQEAFDAVFAWHEKWRGQGVILDLSTLESAYVREVKVEGPDIAVQGLLHILMPLARES